jgi:hypothetical protein
LTHDEDIAVMAAPNSVERCVCYIAVCRCPLESVVVCKCPVLSYGNDIGVRTTPIEYSDALVPLVIDSHSLPPDMMLPL